MERKLIHPEYPFTEAEDAAAWVLLGKPAAAAMQDAAALRSELAIQLADKGSDMEDGWYLIGPRVRTTPDLAAALHLASDIHAGMVLLSAPARQAWLDSWTVIVSSREADERIAQLALLGPDWAVHADEFLLLLTAGKLP